jgi:hypothetical protein
MRRIFYQANFCAECGNALRQARAWWPRYFCEVCARQVKRRSAFWRLFAPLSLLIGALGLAFATHNGGKPALPSNANTAVVSVSASDASAQINRRSVVAEQPTAPAVFCGARTRRGTPCRRMVQPGQRCPQHRGRSSMLGSKVED